MWKIQDHFPVDIQFHPKGQYVALGCVDGIIKVLDCAKGSETHSYKIHNGQIFKLLFHPNPDNYILVSAGEDYSIRVYDMIVSTY